MDYFVSHLAEQMGRKVIGLRGSLRIGRWTFHRNFIITGGYFYRHYKTAGNHVQILFNKIFDFILHFDLNFYQVVQRAFTPSNKLEALKRTSSERVNCMKAISITSFNSILFKAINPPRKSDSFPPRDFRFHIFFAPSFEGGENSLCHTVSI